MNTVTNYTSTHFSPVLIHAELEHVRAHSTKDGLADDNLSIKVAPAVNEVVAAYSVDEHQLEVRLKVPSDWPLHRIEVRDVKRVGVDENRWRAWVLGIQQTIWSHVRFFMSFSLMFELITSCTEWSHHRRSGLVQEECHVAFRRSSGVCYLLFVSFLNQKIKEW